MKLKVTHDGITKTYVALRHTGWFLLESADNVRDGSILNYRAAAVFFAFSFEAYLNHVGQKEIPYWTEIDRISYDQKLRVIEKHLGLTLEYGKRPFQIIGELFKLRNALAHGKTININETIITRVEPDHDSSWRIHEWEKMTNKKVHLYYDCVTKAIELINASCREPDEHVWNQGVRGRKIESIEL